MKPYIYLTGTDHESLNAVACALAPEFEVLESDRSNPVASRLRIKKARAVLYHRSERDEVAAMECALAHEWEVPVFVVGPGVDPGAWLPEWWRYHSTGAYRDYRGMIEVIKKDLLLPAEEHYRVGEDSAFGRYTRDTRLVYDDNTGEVTSPKPPRISDVEFEFVGEPLTNNQFSKL